jgi:uncharacterized membrane protein YfcA
VPLEQILLVAVLFAAVAALYASVGHAGASGYLAVMAIAGVTPSLMRPTALILNILVAVIVVSRFARAGRIDWRALAPFVIASIPLAFLGGLIVLPGTVYKPLVGVVLLAAAARFFVTAGRAQGDEEAIRVPTVPALGIGGGIGLMSGLTGTGGGIFLTPLLLFLRWAGPRHAAGLSSAFILANSTAGLAGNLAGGGVVPPSLVIWLPAVAIGGLLGSELGARRFSPPAIRRALSIVLVVAGLKLIFLG